MFNSYRSSYVSTSPEHVHEHRAPTDDSIRIFSELEAKAKARVLDAYPVESTPLKFTVIQLAHDEASFGDLLVIKYQLGDGPVQKFTWSSDQFLFCNERDAAHELFRSFSEHVGRSVLEEMSKTAAFGAVIKQILRK